MIGKTNFPNVVKESDIQKHLHLGHKEIISQKYLSSIDEELFVQSKQGTRNLRTNPTLGNCGSKEINVMETIDERRNNKSNGDPTVNLKIGNQRNIPMNNKEISSQKHKNLVFNSEVIIKKYTAIVDRDIINEKNIETFDNQRQQNTCKQMTNINIVTNIHKEESKENNDIKRDDQGNVDKDKRTLEIIDKSINSKNYILTIDKEIESNKIIEVNNGIKESNSPTIDKDMFNRKDLQFFHKDLSNNKIYQISDKKEREQKNCRFIDDKNNDSNIDNEIGTQTCITTIDTKINTQTNSTINNGMSTQSSIPTIDNNMGNHKSIKTVDENINIQRYMPGFVDVLDKQINESPFLEVSSKKCFLTVDKVMLAQKHEKENDKQRDFLTIDKEIEEFKKFLDDEKLKFSILNSKCSRNNSKMWRPIEIESVPVINVTATLKEHRMFIKKNNNLKTVNEFHVCLTPEPIEVTGHAMLATRSDESFSDVVPNNSARTEVEYIQICKQHKAMKQHEQRKAVMKAYNKWKTFVKLKKNKMKEIEEQKILTVDDKKLLEKYFINWKKFWEDVKIQKRKLMRQQIKEKKLANLVKAVVVKNKELKLEKLSEVRPTTKEVCAVRSIKIKDVSQVFENRYKALLKIVAEQKEKLVIQKEVIEKFNEEHLLKEVNKFVETSKKTAEFAIKSYDPKLKIKAKLLKQNAEMAIPFKQNKCHVLVKSMTERAEEIKQVNKLAKLRRAEIEEKKRLEELEMIKKKKIEDELFKKKMKMENEKKRELEIKQYLELQLKKVQIERMVLIANKQYEKKLMLKSFEALKNTVQQRNERLMKAHLYYVNNLKMKYFKRLSKFAKNSMEHKMEIAKQFYDVSLLQKYWTMWMRVR